MFSGSIFVLFSSPTLIQILIGWELVGVCSYLLIGQYWEKKDNSSAAMKPFITNKIEDIRLMIGIIILDFGPQWSGKALNVVIMGGNYSQTPYGDFWTDSGCICCFQNNGNIIETSRGPKPFFFVLKHLFVKC